jgi:hypothetical protein
VIGLGAALTGCGLVLGSEAKEFLGQANLVMDDLRSEDYAGAVSALCEETSVEDLREEFGGYAKPWKYDVTGWDFSEHASGHVNVTLTADDGHEQPYTLRMRYQDGRWRACSYSRGTTVSGE